MSESDDPTVFISYSHDSVEHATRVLDLSNRLRGDGINCVLDQYEPHPPEGWPRWMEREIRRARYVIMVCTEIYGRRVRGDESAGTGQGVKWEGNLIYQHLYNAESVNHEFIPVLFRASDYQHIPTPVQGSTHYLVSTLQGYEDLLRRLLGQPKTIKPKLGKPRYLPTRQVRTPVASFLSAPIDVRLWDKAQWRGTLFCFIPGRIPVLGLAFQNEAAARKIFAGWRSRYGDHDAYEELRIAINEGPVEGEDPGYSVHISPDLENMRRRYKENGFEYTPPIIACFTRINRMTPPEGSENLAVFKRLYREHKAYLLVPAILSGDAQQVKPIHQLGIKKGKLHLRHVSEIHEDDLDAVVLDTGAVTRPQWRPPGDPMK